MKKIICALFFVFFNVSIFAGNLYVEQGGDGIYCSENDPCGVIQEAVNIANEDDEIRVGSGVFVENILIETTGITLQGESKNSTVIEAAGGRVGAVGNAGNPLNAILEIRAANVSIKDLSLIHPTGDAEIREAAIFAWTARIPGLSVNNLLVKDCIIERRRNKRTDEPTTPGSRGIFIFNGPGGVIKDNQFRGNYQDHVHLPTKDVIVKDNTMDGASRAGISVMDPVSFVGPNNFDSTNNLIKDNVIMNSLDDGIHIQGDSTNIFDNTIINNGGYGIYLCGDGLLTDEGGGCYFPGELAVSEDNFMKDNTIHNNDEGSIGDDGIGNIVQ